MAGAVRECGRIDAFGVEADVGGEVGIDMEALGGLLSSPEARGRSERMFGTVQDRLVPPWPAAGS